jgi:hypothetical protein
MCVCGCVRWWSDRHHLGGGAGVQARACSRPPPLPFPLSSPRFDSPHNRWRTPAKHNGGLIKTIDDSIGQSIACCCCPSGASPRPGGPINRSIPTRKARRRPPPSTPLHSIGPHVPVCLWSEDMVAVRCQDGVSPPNQPPYPLACATSRGPGKRQQARTVGVGSTCWMIGRAAPLHEKRLPPPPVNQSDIHHGRRRSKSIMSEHRIDWGAGLNFETRTTPSSYISGCGCCC